MTAGKRLSTVLAALLAVLLVVGVTLLARSTVLKPTTISAYFTGATAIYPPGTVIADAAVSLLNKLAERLGYDLS